MSPINPINRTVAKALIEKQKLIEQMTEEEKWAENQYANGPACNYGYSQEDGCFLMDYDMYDAWFKRAPIQFGHLPTDFETTLRPQGYITCVEYVKLTESKYNLHRLNANSALVNAAFARMGDDKALYGH